MRSHLSHLFLTFCVGVGLVAALKVRSPAAMQEEAGRRVEEAGRRVLLQALQSHNREQFVLKYGRDGEMTQEEIDAKMIELGCRKIFSTTSAWNNT